MPFFSSFTGSFTGGRRKPIGIGGGGGGAPGEIDFSSMSVTYQLDDPNDPLYKGQDRFGNTVAIDGTTAVIGAYQAEDAGGNNSGFVAVYDLTDGSRTYSVANPNPFGTSLNDQFGYSVDISGDNFIVGAYQEDTDLVSGLASGKAYIFRTSDGALLHTLDNPNLSGTDTDNFGASVAIYGNYAVVGAPNEQEVGGTLYNAGAIHVYNVTTGALLFSRANPNTGADNPQDAFGRGLDINDQYIVVGATNEDTPASNSGVIHVYDLTGTLLRTIQNPNDYGTAENDGFGGFNRVSISGDKLLAGVNGEDGPAGDAVGVAYVFDLTDGSLLQTLRNPTPVAFDTFAQYVDLDGNYALIGAPGIDNPGGDTNGGAAFIFDITDGSLQSTIINPNVFASTSDGFGTGVAIAGEYVIVGSLEDEAGASNAGKAYVYKGVASGGGGAATYSLDGATQSATTQLPGGALRYLNYNADGTEVTTAYSSGKQLYTVALPTPYDPTSGVANYDSGDPYALINITAGSVAGFRYNNDGTKAFFTHQYANSSPDPTSGHISEFPLGTAYDIFSISSSPNALYDVTGDWYGSNSFNITDINFNTDGSKMFITNAGGLSALGIFEYDLGTEFDLSTATYSQGFDFATDMPSDILPRFGTFNSAGTKFYMADIREEYVYEFDLSTGFDVSTMSYNGVFLDISGIDTGLTQVGLSQDETQLYVTGAQNRRIYTFDLVQE